MTLSYTFGQLPIHEQKNIIKALFEALHKLRGYLYEADLKRFVSWVDDEYHANKNAAGRPSAPARPTRPPEPRTAWDRIRGVMSHRDQDMVIREPLRGGDEYHRSQLLSR